MILSGHKLQGSALQGLHLIWSAGCITSPFIIQSYIPHNRRDLNQTENYTKYVRFTENHTTGYTNISVNVTEDVITNNASEHAGITNKDVIESRIGTAFIIIGGMTLLCSLPLMILSLARTICGLNLQMGAKVNPKSEEEKSTFKGSKLKLCGFLAILALYFMFYIWSEILISQFLATWLTKQLHWSMRMGSIATSVFFAFHCAGRVTGVILSAFCTPCKMLIACVTLTAAGYASLLTLHTLHSAFIWASVGITGLGLSCSFASMLLWASDHIHITGRISVLFLLGNSAGKITAPPLAGFLMQHYTPNWMLYLGTASSLLGILLFISLETFVKFCTSKRTTTEITESDENH